MPDTKELRKVFSVPRKQHNGEKTVQALGMVLSDWPNEIGVKGAIAPSHRADQEKLVTLTVPHRRRTPKYVTEQNLPETMEVRGLQVKLESGELKPTMTASKTALN